MNEVMVFNNAEFGQVRTVVIDGEAWFVGKDVAIALGYGNSSQALKTNVDECDKDLHPMDTVGRGTQNMTIINESGLYSLIFGSRLESAKRFKHWVTSDILPSIRKNGGYIARNGSMTREQIIANALVLANNVIAEKDRQIREMEPKSKYFDSLVDSNLLTNFRDTAKELHMSQTQLTGWLLEKKYVYKDSRGTILPYEPYRENGMFQIKDFVNPYNGFSGRRTYITPKGKMAIKLYLESEGIIPSALMKHGGRKPRS